MSERIRHLLWLSAHGRLMTNEERARRHLTAFPGCAVCGGPVESLIHVLRDCPKAKTVWLVLINPPYASEKEFFSRQPFDWLEAGLKGLFEIMRGLAGDISFAVTLWWMWRWRNGRIFGTDFKVDDIKVFLRKQAKEYTEAVHKHWVWFSA